jgi:aminopeptidase N
MKYSLPTLIGLGLLLAACSGTKKIAEPEMITEIGDTIYVTAPSEEKLAAAPQELPVYRPSYNRTVDLLSTKLDLSFDWEKEEVLGEAWLTFTPLFYPIDEIRLDAKNFIFHRISTHDKAGTKLTYDYNESDMVIGLNRSYERGDTFQIYIDYTARPAKGSENMGGAITSDQGLFFIQPDEDFPEKPKQIWTQGETEFNSRWFPTIDKPNERCSQDITLRVPSHFTTLSNGVLVSSETLSDDLRADRWVQERPHAPYLFMIAVGDFAVIKEEHNNIEISYYVEKDYAIYARDIFDHTAEMIDFFSDILDYPYPWDKYSQIVVRDYVSGAMENTSAVIFGDFVQRERGDLIDNNNDFIVAHELFHHWFGDLVTCESWANLTMNEGFANYSEYLWEEYHKGRYDADLIRLNEIQGYFAEAAEDPHPLIHFSYDNKEDMFDAHSYNKGGLVLHMLRKHLGDELFFEGLSQYLHEHANTAVESHDFRLVMEDVSGQDLNWFFNQWYFGVGHPELEIDYSYDASNRMITLEIQQIQDADIFEPIFIIETPVFIYYKDGSRIEKNIRMDRRKQSWQWESAREPEWVSVDPYKDLLASINTNANTSAEFIYDHAVSLNDKIESLSLMMQASIPDEAFYDKLFQEEFWLLRFLGLNIAGNFGISNSMYSKICEMAVNDPNSNVRAMAYNQLTDNPSSCDPASMIQAVERDSSHGVKVSALPVIYDLQPTKALELASGLSKSNSPQLLIGLGDFYKLKAPVEGQAFFEENYIKIRTRVANTFFENWQVSTSEINKAQKDAVFKKWSDICRSEDHSIHQRAAAYAALLNSLEAIKSYESKDEKDFSHINWLEDELKAIRASSKSENLMGLMDRIGQP